MNVITNTIPNLKNPMRQRILNYPFTYAKVFEMNSFLSDAWMQKLNVVKYYLDKFRLLKVNMGILKHLYEVPSEIYFNVHGSMHRNNILIYKSQQMHMSQSLFFFWELLYMFRVSLPPIFRSTKQL
jgi:hypothetical protein